MAGAPGGLAVGLVGLDFLFAELFLEIIVIIIIISKDLGITKKSHMALFS